MESNPALDDSIIAILHLQKYTKRQDLRLQLIANGFVLADRVLRLHIERLITREKYAIGSCERGYYLIISKDDLEEALHQLKSKAEALSIRANCLIRNHALGKVNQQLTLSL